MLLQASVRVTLWRPGVAEGWAPPADVMPVAHLAFERLEPQAHAVGVGLTCLVCVDDADQVAFIRRRIKVLHSKVEAHAGFLQLIHKATVLPCAATTEAVRAVDHQALKLSSQGVA